MTARELGGGSVYPIAGGEIPTQNTTGDYGDNGGEVE